MTSDHGVAVVVAAAAAAAVAVVVGWMALLRLLSFCFFVQKTLLELNIDPIQFQFGNQGFDQRMGDPINRGKGFH